MKKVIILAALAIASLTSCDKVTTNIEVDDVTFDFEAITAGSPSSSSISRNAAMTSTFSVTRSVSLAEIGSSELMKYADRITKIAVNSSLLKVTIEPSGEYTVTNLTVSAVGVPGSLVVPEYVIGDVFTPPANMETYTIAFIMKLLNNEPIEVTVSGQTDAPTGVKVKISYENDLVFTAKVLN